jgi:hypothetical protein
MDFIYVGPLVVVIVVVIVEGKYHKIRSMYLDTET